MPTMPPLHVLLPELERAVERKIEAAVLMALPAPDLRELVHLIVANYRLELAKPDAYLDRLIDSARVDGDTLTEARVDSLAARSNLLEHLLEVLRPGIGALVGPILRDIWHRPGKNDVEETDPLLRGFELVDGCKKGNVGKGRYERSGESLWIVVLAPVEPVVDHDYDPRYAVLEHSGETADEHESHAWNLVRLVTVDEAASRVRDDKIADLFAGVLKRLRSAASGRNDDLAGKVREATRRIDRGLQAMEDE